MRETQRLGSAELGGEADIGRTADSDLGVSQGVLQAESVETEADGQRTPSGVDWEEVCTTCANFVAKRIMPFSCMEDRQDIFQSAFLGAWRSRFRYNPELGDPYKFARQNAWSYAKNYSRKELRSSRHLGLYGVDNDGAEYPLYSCPKCPDIVELVSRSEFIGLIGGSILRLGQKHRDMVRRVYWGGEEWQVFQKEWGVTRSRVSQNRRKALDTLRDIINLDIEDIS